RALRLLRAAPRATLPRRGGPRPRPAPARRRRPAGTPAAVPARAVAAAAGRARRRHGGRAARLHGARHRALAAPRDGVDRRARGPSVRRPALGRRPGGSGPHAAARRLGAPGRDPSVRVRVATPGSAGSDRSGRRPPVGAVQRAQRPTPEMVHALRPEWTRYAESGFAILDFATHADTEVVEVDGEP